MVEEFLRYRGITWQCPPPGSKYLCKTRVVFRDPSPKISGSIQTIPINFCTLIVLLEAHQNTSGNFQKSDLLRHIDIITKINGKFRTSTKPDK